MREGGAVLVRKWQSEGMRSWIDLEIAAHERVVLRLSFLYISLIYLQPTNFLSSMGLINEGFQSVLGSDLK